MKTSIRRVFDAAYLSALTVTLPYWALKNARTGKQRDSLRERLRGDAPRGDETRSRVWLHAVSLGEVMMLRPLIERMQQARPDLQVHLSATTDTGLAAAQDMGENIRVFRAPLDFSWAVRRSMTRISPSLLVLAELELWPNLLLEARRRHVPVVVVNARVSDRSFRGYQRVKPVLREALRSVRWWGAQTDEYAERIRSLVGEDPADITVTGSMKYDGAVLDRENPDTKRMASILGIEPGQRVFVAGSTMSPEESILIELWPRLSRVDPDLRFVLVPRHPERFQSVRAMLDRAGIAFALRSQLPAAGKKTPRVILVDSIGELKWIWGLADFGFVGGSLFTVRGGQNMIEPAAVGVACAFGPRTSNFKATVEQLLLRNAAVRVESAGELETTLVGWCRNPSAARSMGERARQFILGQQGSLERTWSGVSKFLPAPMAIAR